MLAQAHRAGILLDPARPLCGARRIVDNELHCTMSEATLVWANES